MTGRRSGTDGTLAELFHNGSLVGTYSVPIGPTNAELYYVGCKLVRCCYLRGGIA